MMKTFLLMVTSQKSVMGVTKELYVTKLKRILGPYVSVSKRVLQFIIYKNYKTN